MNSGLQVSVGIIIQNQLLANKVKYQLQRLQQFELLFEYETIKEYEFNQKRIQSHPQVLLLELDTRDHQHLDQLSLLHKPQHNNKLIVFASFVNIKQVGQLLERGAHACHSTAIPLNNLSQIINDVILYGAHLSPDLVNLIRLNLQTNSLETRFQNLTKREMQIARSTISGKTYKELSEELFVSTYTINHHLKNIYKKLNIKSKAQLVALLNTPGNEPILPNQLTYPNPTS